MESGVDSSVLPGVANGDTLLPGFPRDPPNPLYRKLRRPTCFRLIMILSVSPHLDCMMSTVDLDIQYPSYHALSYCWGSPNRDVTLQCNGRKLGISSNLAEGLKRLHAYAVEAQSTTPTLFWVDQICINQEDNDERTQQVRMMRSIYQQSTHTLIWLPLKNGECYPLAKD